MSVREDLAEQEVREENATWHRTSERQKQLDKEVIYTRRITLTIIKS
jgi:hypothetical protein